MQDPFEKYADPVACYLEKMPERLRIEFPSGHYVIFYRDRGFGRWFTPEGLRQDRKAHQIELYVTEILQGGATATAH